MKKLLLLITLIVAITLTTAIIAYGTDYIVLSNGDVIVGEIISETELTIVIRTSFGDISINVIDIIEIREDVSYGSGETVEVILYDGSKIKGTVVEDTDTILKLQTDLGLIDILKSNIANYVVGGFSTETDIETSSSTGTTGLNPETFERLMEYQKRAIFVDIFTYQGTQNMRWLIRRGNMLLSEIEFLNIIGKEEVARQLEQDIANRQTFFWVFIASTAIFGGATAVGAVGLIPDVGMSQDQAITLLVVGGTLTTLSVIGIVSSTPKSNYLSYTMTKNAADEYNRRLRLELELSIQDVRLINGTEKYDNDFSEDDQLLMELEKKNQDESESDFLFLGGLLPTGTGLSLFININF